MLNVLNKMIGTQDTGWHEYNLEIAAAAVDDLDGESWEELKELIKTKPSFWQARCAEALYESDSKRSLDLLAYLLKYTDEKEVALVAVCALNDADYELSLDYESCLKRLLSKLNKTRETRYEDVEQLLLKLKD